MAKGFFLETQRFRVRERKEKWESGELNSTFYCQKHYQLATGLKEPVTIRKRAEKRSRAIS